MINNTLKNNNGLRIATPFLVTGIALILSAPQAFAQDTQVAMANEQSPQPAMAGESTQSPHLWSEADLRLALDKVTLYADAGHIDEALDLLDQIKKEYPHNAEVCAVASELHLQRDNRGMAFAEASDANSSGGVDGETHQRAALLSPNGEFLAGGYNNRITNESYENIETVTGQMALSPDLAISTDLENDHINTRVPFLRTNGTRQSYSGNRQQGTVTADKLFTNGQEVLGSLYANDDSAGVGALYRLWDHSGATSIAVNFNRPESDYIEMAVQHGTQSNVMIERKQIISEDVQARIDGKFTQYSLDGASNAASAPGWDFDLDYSHPFEVFAPHDPITLGAHYTVAAEYFSHIGSSFDTSGEAFSPLPVASYEVHSFTGSVGKELFARLNVEISGGISVNRIIGNSGPIYGVMANYAFTKNLGLNVHATRNLLGGQNESEKEDNVGADLKWTW